MMNKGNDRAEYSLASIHHSSFCTHHLPRAVLFDAVGTLIRPEPSVAAAYARVGRRHGIEIAEAEMHGLFRAAMAQQDEIDRRLHAGRTSQERERERWRGIVADVFGAAPQAGAIFDDLWEHFANPQHWQLFDDASGAWQALAAAGVTIGIASNFDDRLDGICRALTPLSDCRHVFVSSRVGWRKPRPEFFAAIADELGFEPAEMLLVGDDLENDFRAARAAGWQAVLVERAESSAAGTHTDQEPRASESISSLSELLGQVRSA
ncbi:MAG TPA: HAD-IA family hydrolase [Pirellulales bacterium]|nr:HAD-IA family hydrolase [Pirellulales bacterium]